MTTFEDCTQCGQCNAVDPILAAVRKESASSRYKMVLAKQNKANSIFYLSTDAGMQDTVCPSGIKLGNEFRKMREKCVEQGITTKENERMVENFRKYGTPYESMDVEDWHDKPVW